MVQHDSETLAEGQGVDTRKPNVCEWCIVTRQKLEVFPTQRKVAGA